MGQRFISKCIAARVCFEEAITSGGSAINRGYSLPDSCTVPLSNAIDKKFHGRRPAKRAKMVDSPRTDIRWRFMFHAPLFTTSRHGRSQKFSASGTNKNSISSVTLTRSIHLRPARLSLSLSFCEIELERFRRGGTSVWRSLTGWKSNSWGYRWD